MAVPFAVTDIQERVRIRCDLPVYTSNTKITTNAILMLVQESARDLAAELNELDWFFVTTASATTTPNVPLVSLPTNFAALYRVAWLQSADRVIPLQPANLEDVHPSPQGYAWESFRPGYRLDGNVLEFFPTPSAVYALEIRYSTGIFIASAADTLMGQLGWDTWIVYNCCCIVKQRQGEDYSAFAMERDRTLDRILRNTRRDKTGVTQPRDTRGDGDYCDDRDRRWWML